MSNFDLSIGRAETGEDGRKVRRCKSRGASHRRIVRSYTKDGIEHSYHATKGWRHVRVESAQVSA